MLIGHHFQWEYLKKIAERGETPHAFLFCGEKQLGKRKVAMEFVKLLFGPDDAQKTEKGIHPDFILVQPDAPKESPEGVASRPYGAGKHSAGQAPKESKHPTGQASNSIHISQIRELNSRFGFKPSLAPLKVAIIDDAHRMNSAAQSAFLKLLEEPKGSSLFILISSLPNLLLPTILSRTQIVKFYRVPVAEVEKYLFSQNLPEKTSELLLNFYDGRPGLILELISNPRKLEEKIAWTKEMDRLIGSDLVSRFKYAESLSKNPGKIDEILESWQEYFRKKLISGLGGSEASALLSSLGRGRPASEQGTGWNESQGGLISLQNILHRLQTVKFLISSTNINPRLALEILMLEL